jgi:hypothetical protein
MTTILLKQLQMINAIWGKYTPKTEEDKQNKKEVMEILGEQIKQIKFVLQNEEVFEINVSDISEEHFYDQAC